MLVKHKRADKVKIVGTGSAATVFKYGACRCGEQSDVPGTDGQREVWWRIHRENVKREAEVS